MLIINRPFWPYFVFSLTWMSVAATSLLRDNYHHSSCWIYIMLYFRHLIEYVFNVSLLYLQNVCYYDSVYVLSFRSRINLDHIW